MQGCFGKQATWHDVAIALYRQTLACETQGLYQLSHRKGGHIELPGITVDRQMNQLNYSLLFSKTGIGDRCLKNREETLFYVG